MFVITLIWGIMHEGINTNMIINQDFACCSLHHRSWPVTGISEPLSNLFSLWLALLAVMWLPIIAIMCCTLLVQESCSVEHCPPHHDKTLPGCIDIHISAHYTCPRSCFWSNHTVKVREYRYPIDQENKWCLWNTQCIFYQKKMGKIFDKDMQVYIWMQWM